MRRKRRWRRSSGSLVVCCLLIAGVVAGCHGQDNQTDAGSKTGFRLSLSKREKPILVK